MITSAFTLNQKPLRAPPGSPNSKLEGGGCAKPNASVTNSSASHSSASSIELGASSFSTARKIRQEIESKNDIANSFDGVEQSYALQAGREVRIIVRPETVDDLAALRLSRDIAKKIEETMQYPGQIKVQVIRETRSVEFAR